MKSDKILITGSQGYIGGALYSQLLCQGRHAFGVDIVDRGLPQGTLVIMDAGMFCLTTKHEFSTVYHLAAMTNIVACEERQGEA